MQVFEELKRDHKSLLSILNQLSRVSEKSPEHRSALLNELSRALYSHSRIEEAVVYSLLLGSIDDESESDRAFDALDRHSEFEIHLSRLKSLDCSSDNWANECSAFKRTLEKHISEEEQDLFARIPMILSPEEMDEMSELFSELKSEAMSLAESHPKDQPKDQPEVL